MKKIYALVSMIIAVNTANIFCMQLFEEINIQPKQQEEQHTKNNSYGYSRPQEKNNESKPEIPYDMLIKEILPFCDYNVIAKLKIAFPKLEKIIEEGEKKMDTFVIYLNRNQLKNNFKEIKMLINEKIKPKIIGSYGREDFQHLKLVIIVADKSSKFFKAKKLNLEIANNQHGNTMYGHEIKSAIEKLSEYKYEKENFTQIRPLNKAERSKDYVEEIKSCCYSCIYDHFSECCSDFFSCCCCGCLKKTNRFLQDSHYKLSDCEDNIFKTKGCCITTLCFPLCALDLISFMLDIDMGFDPFKGENMRFSH